jgi:hypothetical protein
MAYGEAARIIEMRGRNFAHGRDRVRDVRLEAQSMARDIAGRMRDIGTTRPRSRGAQISSLT